MLKTKIGNIELETCVYNASGVNCASESDLKLLANSDVKSGVVLCKSCTFESRIGNPLPRYYDNKILSINSSGLPNEGYKFYGDISTELKSISSKPYFTSISGLSLNDNINIVNYMNSCQDVDGIELNLSCPNVIGKPQTGYDFEAMDNTIRNISEIIDKRLIFGLKLPPYFDISHFEQATSIINEYPIDTITCINSIGNGLVIDYNTESVVIKPKGGLGGIGGISIKSTALANVNYFYNNTKCDIIGCGGVTNGIDAFEHILCGASAIQIGTEFMKQGTTVFEKISNDLKTIMKTKKYSKIENFKGKLITL